MNVNYIKNIVSLSLVTINFFYLIKGLVMARIVLINHEGWTIIKDFRFFRSLKADFEVVVVVVGLFVFFNQTFMILHYKLAATSCQSSGSTSSASRGQASSCEEWPRSGRRSCSPPLPSAPTCWSHTWPLKTVQFYSKVLQVIQLK